MVIRRWLFHAAFGALTSCVVLVVLYLFPAIIDAGVAGQFVIMLIILACETPAVLLDRPLFWEQVYGSK